MATLLTVMQTRIAADNASVDPNSPALMAPENSNGLGFQGVYQKWLTEDGPGKEPNAFTTPGTLKPVITIILPNTGENQHPSATVSGIRKWDITPNIYLFHYPGDHGKEILDLAKLRMERVLQDPSWQPVISGGQRPVFSFENEIHIDNREQFPGNYALVLIYRVTGMRFVPE